MRGQRWIVVMLVGLVACSGGDDDDDDDDAFCGDGSCIGAEDCASCQADCGACPVGCGDGTCAASEDCDTCAPDCGQCTCAPGDGTCGLNEACIDAACQGAFGRIWSIIVVSGNMPVQNGAGEAWDALGGAPDPFVEIELNGTVVAMTSEKADTFTATWNEFIDANIPAGSSLVFWVYDSDVSENDLMFTCTFDPLRADVLDARAGQCAGAGFDLQVGFEP